MKIKVSDYEINFEAFKQQIQRKPESRRIDFVSEFSAISYVPIVVVYKFYERLYGQSELVTNRIEKALTISGHTLEN